MSALSQEGAFTVEGDSCCEGASGFRIVQDTSNTSYIDSSCNSNLENIFKVYPLKIRYEKVQYLYDKKEKVGRFKKNDYFLYRIFEEITGFPMEGYEEQPLPRMVAWMSEEEINSYFERLNCKPEEALKEYVDFIRDIKLEKDIYLKCINAELAKGDSSEYAKDRMGYKFKDPLSSLLPPFITKLDFLDVFKEFVINGNEEILPDDKRMYIYLKHGRKTP